MKNKKTIAGGAVLLAAIGGGVFFYQGTPAEFDGECTPVTIVLAKESRSDYFIQVTDGENNHHFRTEAKPPFEKGDIIMKCGESYDF